ncbi:MAG: hypothetical protein FWG65_11805 [Turicibacter sp.]|nr:hypothetical protein [Turicibacter sp.]
MIIYDEDNRRQLYNLTLLLNENEIHRMMEYLDELLLDLADDGHFHLNSADFSKEITLAVYDDESPSEFALEYRRAIAEQRAKLEYYFY